MYHDNNVLIIIAVVNIQPSTENELVFESDGTVKVCLMKDIDTSQSFDVTVVIQESATSDNSATGI